MAIPAIPAPVPRPPSAPIIPPPTLEEAPPATGEEPPTAFDPGTLEAASLSASFLAMASPSSKLYKSRNPDTISLVLPLISDKLSSTAVRMTAVFSISSLNSGL